MAYLKSFSIHTQTEGAYNITREISSAVTESGIEDGIVLIYCPHTTAGIIINENTDINVTTDMLFGLKEALPDRDEYRHSEGNSHAHIKSSVVGNQIFLFVDGGWPLFGPWQGVFFVEFDGPRERHYHVKVIEC